MGKLQNNIFIRVYWHSPKLKQGDSCFFHHCIGKYLTVLQCLTRCPQAIFILFPHALRYSFLIFMPTAAAVLFSKYWCLHSYPGHELRDTRGTPRYECADFSPADSDSHRNCRSGCSDTSLVLCGFHFHTTQLYIPAFRKTLPRKHLLWILPVYGSGMISLILHLNTAGLPAKSSAW